jgi:putative DNA methylase
MTVADDSSATSASTGDVVVTDVRSRLIDRWFPCADVDEAVGTPAGSGRSEKALFTWFASRPIAQARAAILTTLLPDDDDLRGAVRAAVKSGNRKALDRLRDSVLAQYPQGRPVVLDIFSGRGIIPLEAARLGVTAVGTDLSPVATIAGRVLSDYPLRDWSTEPPLPFKRPTTPDGAWLFDPGEPRILSDVRTVVFEVGQRVAAAVAPCYPRSINGTFPWAYLWAITIPCDNCRRRFPLIGSMVLRHPYRRTDDDGQSLHLITDGDNWRTGVIDGTPDQEPTISAAVGSRRKAARCLFCGHVHSLDTLKSLGNAGQYRDALLAVGEELNGPRKVFRPPTAEEIQTAESVDLMSCAEWSGLSAVPNEPIPPGNQDTVRASGYGYRTYGELANPRQTLKFVETVRAIRAIHGELLKAGLSEEYAAALTAYAAANIPRQLRYATRGANLRSHGNASGTGQNRVQVSDVFSDESKLSFNFDYVEAGPGHGPGTWTSVSESGFNALKKVLDESPDGRPGRFRMASAVALPFRDGSVDAVVTDPPYYNMIDYLDASDLFYVWLHRALIDVFPDLFQDTLQDKTDEIIVKRGNAPGEHRTKDFYESMLNRAFEEARRVLRPDGHLVVVFGHSDPDAWRRLLGALHDAKFVVTSSWPSRTETASTGVASIKVTVTIGCRVASPNRRVATAAQVDREVAEAVKVAVREWDRDGLALYDQLMAAYGPAMEVYGQYSKILKPDGQPTELDRYLTLARAAVRDAAALRLDELPLETFDAPTRFAAFWQRLYGRTDVPKGEARFLAQADNLRIEDMRGPLLTESKSGFKLRFDAPAQVTERSSTFEVARAMAAAWNQGATDAVAAVIADAERPPTDAHLWAVVGEIIQQLPPSDPVAKALTAVQRNTATIGTMVQRAVAERRTDNGQLTLNFSSEEA